MDEISKASHEALKYIAKYGRIKETVTDEIVNQLLARGYIVPTGEDFYFDITEDGKAYLRYKHDEYVKMYLDGVLFPLLVSIAGSIIVDLLLYKLLN